MEPISSHAPRRVVTPGMHAHGFTLLEVLVSTSILVLLVVMLNQVLGRVSNVWREGHAMVEKSEDGMAVLEFMAKELQAALLPASGTSQTNLQLVVNPSLGSQYLNRDAIFWQAPLATDQSMGDIAEFGYFVKWDNSNKNNPRANLCRFFVNPGTSGTADPNYLIYTNPTAWVSGAILENVAPADNSNTNAPYQGLFVENVLALWVTCLDPVGNTITKNASGASLTQNSFDSRNGYVYTDATGKTVTKAPCALPAAIDVSFILIDSNSANRITNSLQTSIVTLAGKVGNANDFAAEATNDTAFKPILSGLRPCTTRVYLYNSK